MAAPIGEGDFDSWLSSKLLLLNPDTDIEVFVQYIRSILDTEVDQDERSESIKDFLSQITDVDLDSHTTNVIKVYNEKEGTKVQSDDDGPSGFDQQLASAVEKAQAMKVSAKVVTKEDEERKKAKQAILAQYSQVCDGEESDEEVHREDQDGLVQNVNAKVVGERLQAEREKNKQDYEVKKQKDKEDREKQKQKAEDRKDAEKKRTQKGEKRR